MQPEDKINELIKAEGIDTNKISDGYHTFGELYEHRIALFMALCKIKTRLYEESGGEPPWKSKLHYDGTSLDGWFIAGLFEDKGKQISYHLPISVWDSLVAEELERAPEWDGHTPADVLERLKSI